MPSAEPQRDVKGSIVALAQARNALGVQGISIAIWVSGDVLHLASDTGELAPLWSMTSTSSLRVGLTVEMHGFVRLPDANAACTQLVEIDSECVEPPSFDELATTAVNFNAALLPAFRASSWIAGSLDPAPMQIAVVKGSIGHISLPVVSANLGTFCGCILHDVTVASTAILDASSDDDKLILNTPGLLILGVQHSPLDARPIQCSVCCMGFEPTIPIC